MAYLKLQDDQGRSIRVIVLNESEDGSGTWHIPLVDSSGNLKAVLVAGAAAIGKLAANSGVDIGDVDVTSVIPGSGATNLGKAEDAAHTSGDTGVLLLAVRQDTAAALAGTDADYIPLIVDANGRLHVLDANSAAVKTAVELIDNAISGNEMQVDVVAALPAGDNNIGNVDIVSGGGGTEYAVDAALGATPTGTAAIAKRDDALSALTPVEGDAIELRVDANGALWTHDDALDAALSGSEMQVDVVAALPAGTNAIGKLAANTGVDIGDVDILSIAAGTNQIGARSKAGLSNSGVKSADAAIKASAGDVYWMSVSDTAALAIELNNSTDNTGTDLWAMNLPANAYAHFIFDPPIEFSTGIYLDVSTGTCKVTIGYK